MFYIKMQRPKNKSTWRILLCNAYVFCIFLLSMSSSLLAQHKPLALVHVTQNNLAQSEILKLGDIAGIQAEDASIRERLQAISLGYSPQVGAVREIQREKIVLAIAAAGFATGTVQVESDLVVTIRRAAQRVEPDLVREAVERAVLNELNAAGATARLIRLEMPSLIEAPSGTIEVRASPNGLKDIFSPFIVSVELWVDKRLARRFNVTTQVEAFAQVYVATRDLPEGARIRKEDIVMEARRLERDLSSYIRDINQLRGIATKRVISRGEAITMDKLISVIVIKPGDTVRIIGTSNLLQIAVTGEAKAAGHVGDRIQVINNQSGTPLQAIVEDEGLVKIQF
jgi:flagella basal body P-ring formation protein FlgA